MTQSATPSPSSPAPLHAVPGEPFTVSAPPKANETHDARLPEMSAPIELRIPAHSEHVKVARATVAAVASRMRFSFNEVEDIKLAVAEACNNAILHAVPDSPATASIVDITLVPLPDRLEIRVADKGHLADVSSLPVRSIPAEGLSTADELPEGGLGLMLIRSLMDEVDLLGGLHDNTVVRMVKRIKYGRGR